MAKKKETYKKQAPRDANQYFSLLEDLLRRNTGQFTNIGYDTQSSSKPIRYGRKPVPQTVVTPSISFARRTIEKPEKETAQQPQQPQQPTPDKTVSIDDFMQNISQQVGQPEMLSTDQADSIYQQTQRAYGVQQLRDGGVVYNDGRVRYQDGTIRDYDPVRDQAYPIASQRNGSVLFSDGSQRYYDQNQQAYPIASHQSGGVVYSDGTVRQPMQPDDVAQNITPSPLMSMNDGRVLYDDFATRAGNTQQLDDMQGPGGLSKFLFQGKEQTVTQPFGNYNPGVEITSSGVNYGTDYRTRDLSGSDREIKLPVSARVVEVSNDNSWNRGYGNSILLEFGNGEKIRLSHLDQVANIRPGQTIAANQTIGTPGETGNTYGEHLDVEYIDASGNFKDPNQFNAREIAQSQGEVVPGQLTGSSRGSKTVDTSGLSSTQAQFIKNMLPYAQSIEDRFGIPMELTLAQAAHESGWNPNAMTLFGIKGAGDAGSANLATTEDYGQGLVGTTGSFAQYSDRMTEFDAYAEQLMRNWPQAIELAQAGDMEGAFRALQEQGRLGAYATDPQYVQKLQNTLAMIPIIQAETATTGRQQSPIQSDSLASSPSGLNMSLASRDSIPQKSYNNQSFNIRPVAQASDGQIQGPTSIPGQLAQMVGSAAQKTGQIGVRAVSPVATTAGRVLGAAIDKPVDQLNPTGEFDLGITEGTFTPQAAAQRFDTTLKYGTPQRQNTLLGRTRQSLGNLSEAIGDTLGIPEGGFSEIVAGGPTRRSNVAYAAEFNDPKRIAAAEQRNNQVNDSLGITQKIGDTARAAKELTSRQLNKAGQGIKSAGQAVQNIAGKATDLFDKGLDKITPDRAVGNQSSGFAQVSGETSNIAERSKGDIRDPFFKMGGAEAYKDYMVDNAETKKGGALGLDLFKENFFAQPDYIRDVFGSTSLGKAATDKYRSQEARKYPKMSEAQYGWGKEYEPNKYDKRDIEDYNKGVREYNSEIDRYLKSIPSVFTGDTQFTPPADPTNRGGITIGATRSVLDPQDSIVQPLVDRIAAPISSVRQSLNLFSPSAPTKKTFRSSSSKPNMSVAPQMSVRQSAPKTPSFSSVRKPSVSSPSSGRSSKPSSRVSVPKMSTPRVSAPKISKPSRSSSKPKPAPRPKPKPAPKPKYSGGQSRASGGYQGGMSVAPKQQNQSVFQKVWNSIRRWFS